MEREKKYEKIARMIFIRNFVVIKYSNTHKFCFNPLAINETAQWNEQEYASLVQHILFLENLISLD